VASGTVLTASDLSSTSGNQKSFQTGMKFTTATAAMAGRSSGMMMRTKMPVSLQPSMRAADMSSSGIERMKSVNMNMPKGMPMAMFTSITEPSLSWRPRLIISLSIDMVPSFMGMISPMRKNA